MRACRVGGAMRERAGEEKTGLSSMVVAVG